MQYWLDNWYKRKLVGIILVALGVFCGWVGENSEIIVKGICGELATGWCLPVRIAFIDLGWNGLAYTLISIGCILALLYDFVSEILASILAFALNHVANAKLVVIRALEQGRMSQAEGGEVLVEAGARLAGKFDKNGQSLSKFLVDRFLHQVHADGGFWRRDYYANINVETLPDDSLLERDKYLSWSETTRFTVENAFKKRIYKYSSISGIELPETSEDELLEKILTHIKYDVRAGGKKVFSLEEFRSSLDLDGIRSESGFARNGVRVSFKNGLLSVSVHLDIEVNDTETDIVIDESSFIALDDRIYELSFVEATKGLTFRLSLPHGFKIVHEGVSGLRYGTSRPKEIEAVFDGESRLRVDGVSWCLPGIVAVVVWREP
ncbi:hypothetical protein SAMN04488037_1187 [Shimia marina]|uniref:Uncharacterized protein n=1 Tax=Shimia marina TaxID=321267 RepID=A0A0P1FAX1_9RHOB|nr:hypothetical protein SHM7688_01645 [Shimia marina]SFE73623.1 hypothetical protein SAMN04488037_1187 [Shimia marina]